MANGLNARNLATEWGKGAWFAKRQRNKQRRQAARREIEARIIELIDDGIIAAEELTKELDELYGDLCFQDDDWGWVDPFPDEEYIDLDRELDLMLGGFCN